MRAIGGISAEFGGMPYPERFVRAEKSEIRCPDAAAAEKMCLCIDQIIHSKDTLGGLLEIVATGVPAGLGSFAQ